MANTDKIHELLVLLAGGIKYETGKQPHISQSYASDGYLVDLGMGYTAFLSKLTLLNWLEHAKKGNKKLLVNLMAETIKQWMKQLEDNAVQKGKEQSQATPGTIGAIEPNAKSWWGNQIDWSTAVPMKSGTLKSLPKWEPKTLEEMYEGPQK